MGFPSAEDLHVLLPGDKILKGTQIFSGMFRPAPIHRIDKIQTEFPSQEF
jgi:hypothetical protein